LAAIDLLLVPECFDRFETRWDKIDTTFEKPSAAGFK